MIGQAAERLGADDVVNAAVVQLQHLGGQQPALAHLHAGVDHLVAQLDDVLERRGRAETAVRFDRADELALLAQEKFVDQLHRRIAQLLDAVELCIAQFNVDAEDQEVEQTGQHHLRALVHEQLLQMVVAQRRKLDVDFAHNAHAHLLFLAARYGGEGLYDLPVDRRCARNKRRIALHEICQLLRFLRGHALRLAGIDLVGLDLVFERHEHVAEQHGVQKPHHHRHA